MPITSGIPTLKFSRSRRRERLGKESNAAPKGASDFEEFAVSLKRYPDTKPEFAVSLKRYPDTKPEFAVSLKRYPDTKPEFSAVRETFMPVAIRSARLNDVPAILAIEQQALAAAHWTSEQYNKLVSGGTVLLAEEAGQLCGFVCAQAVAGEWEIENVVVAAGFLRRGIASELVRELMRRAENEAASAILLEVRESNLPARGLYEKHGFREVGRRRGYYRDPVEDAILYALRFDR
jgi:ribosomal-protein-alanine N-acetyltransferase